MKGHAALAPSIQGLGRRHGRIGLLGGSFNPAHEGHLHVSKVALKRLNLDAVWWLVSPQNPLKSSNGMAPFEARFASAVAMARHPRIHPSRLEVALETRYTADTIEKLQRRFPTVHFVWLMGADNLIQLPRWDRWADIVARIPIAVFGRPTYSLRAMTGKAAQRYARHRIPAADAGRLPDRAAPVWIFVSMRLHPASATALRAAGVVATHNGGS
jgi:nicotinate-nucleotide adenylyltransferase